MGLLKFACAAVLATGLFGLGSVASANTLEFTWSALNGAYSGGTPSAATGNTYLTAEFNDTGTNQVTLTLTANFPATAAEDIDQIDFNITDPTLISTMSYTFVPPSVSVQASPSGELNAGPAFDFAIEFDTGQGGNSVLALQDVVTITFKNAKTFEANMFKALSSPGNNGFGPYYAAAHIQNTPTQGSGWAASGIPASPAPLPSPLALPTSAPAGLGLLALLGVGAYARGKYEARSLL